MKRAKDKGGAGGAMLPGVVKEALEEASLLFKAAEAFRELETDARRVAEGGKPVSDLSPGGKLGRLAKRAEEWEAAWEAKHGKRAWTDPHPLAELARVVDALRDFARWKDDPMPKDAEELRRYLEAVVFWRNKAMQKERAEWGGKNHLPPRRATAYELAADCRAFGAVAEERVFRVDAILAREAMRADAAAELAKVKAELAEAKGDKIEAAKWRKKHKAEIEAGRLAMVVYHLGMQGWTVKQVAESLGVSESTVERLARRARGRGHLKERDAGRRKQVIGKPRTGRGLKRPPNREEAERVEGAIQKAFDKQSVEEWEQRMREERSGAWDEEEE